MSVFGERFGGDKAPWQEDALCRQVDPELFFPEQGVSPKAAKRICRECRVSAECLRYALERDIPFGIFGGVTARERHRLMGAKVPRPVGVCLHGHNLAEVGVYADGGCKQCSFDRNQAWQRRRRWGVA